MPTDMMRAIELEIAKREQGRKVDMPWWADVSMRALADIPRQKERAAQWNERKNSQRQQIMNGLAKGTSLVFDNEDVASRKARLQRYYDKYKGNMDETTLEMGQFMLEDFDIQSEKNTEFNKLINDGEQFKKDMMFDMQNIGRDEEGKPRTLDESDYKLITESQRKWIDHTNNIQTNFADRLSLKPFQHMNAELTNATNMNQFLLSQARDDNLIDDRELQAYSDSWNTGSLDPIDKYNNDEKAGRTAAINYNVSQIQTKSKQFDELQSLIFKGGTVNVELPNDPGKMPHTIEELQQYGLDLGFISDYESLKQELKNVGETTKDMTGTDFLGDVGINLDDPSVEPSAEEKAAVERGMTVGEYKTSLKEVEPSKTQEALGISSEDYKEISGDVTSMAWLAAPYGIAKTAQATKWLASKANKGARYIKSAINLSNAQVEEFLNAKSVKNTSKKLDKLEKGLKKYKKGSSKYEIIKDKIQNTRSGQTKYWADKFGKSEADIGRLYKTGNRSKWNVFKMRRNLTKRFPKFAGKLGGRYALGSTLTDIAGFETEGKTRMAIDLGAGYATEKAVTKKFLPQLIKMVTSDKGKKLLTKRLGKTAAKRIVTSTTAGSIVPGWGNIAMALVGSGLAAYDIYNLVKNYKEEEE